MPWTNPKTDWDTNPTNPLPSDFNRIEGNIDYLKTDIETKKGLIVDALNSVGIAALIADTHVQLASKITGAKKTGISITPGTVNQEIPKGIYDTGDGTVLGDPDLISANIKSGINIFGVVGSSSVVDTSDATIATGDVLSGKTGYKNGAKITGNIPSKVAAVITPSAVNQQIAAGQYLSGIQTIVGSANLSASNIKSGVNIFGVVGTMTPVPVVTSSDFSISSISSSGVKGISVASFPMTISDILGYIYLSSASGGKFYINGTGTVYIKDMGTGFYTSLPITMEGSTSSNILIFNPSRNSITISKDATGISITYHRLIK